VRLGVEGEADDGVSAVRVGVMKCVKVTPMTKTQVYLRREELEALHRAARRSKRSVAALVREAVQARWIPPTRRGPVALFDGPVAWQSSEHDRIYDAP
jgi:Holliday junction resolvase